MPRCRPAFLAAMLLPALHSSSASYPHQQHCCRWHAPCALAEAILLALIITFYATVLRHWRCAKRDHAALPYVRYRDSNIYLRVQERMMVGLLASLVAALLTVEFAGRQQWAMPSLVGRQDCTGFALQACHGKPRRARQLSFCVPHSSSHSDPAGIFVSSCFAFYELELGDLLTQVRWRPLPLGAVCKMISRTACSMHSRARARCSLGGCIRCPSAQACSTHSPAAICRWR